MGTSGGKRQEVVLVLAVALASLGGIDCSKLDPKECVKLRESAFELVNQAHQCTTDADCKPSEWPGCTKPISATSVEKIRPIRDTYQKGKCEEPKAECKPAPPIFCQEGLCAFRYKPFQGPGEVRIEQ
jgi:hypothetical protein